MSPSEPIGVGIIGTGSISNAHVKGYQAHSRDCRILAVADIDEAKAKAAAQEIGPDVAAYNDYEQLLARDDIQLVSICTPPFVHAPAAIAALQAGKHVLVEKPMAASLAEADAMLRAAEESGRSLNIVFQYRFGASWWEAKQVVESGLLGPLKFGSAQCLWWRGHRYYEAWWRGTWEQECGGATINHAVHHIDMLLWLMGPVESVYADMETVAHDVEVEDLSLAIVRFASGALGSIVSTVSDHHNLDRIEVTGERAAISLPWDVRALKELPNGFGEPAPDVVQEIEAFRRTVKTPPHGGHAAQIADVIAAIREGRPSTVDGVEGRRSLELITAIYKSASTGEKVCLPLSPDDPFYTTEGLRAHVKRAQTTRDAQGAG